MRTYRGHRNGLLAAIAGVALLVSACSSTGATGAPATAAARQSAPASAGTAASAAASAAGAVFAPGGGYGSIKPLKPAVDLGKVGGPGEGALNLIIWPGYAEDGSNVKEYDWVHPFEAETGCKVNSKPANTSDEMVTLLRQGGGTVYDGVSASGDATLRLIANGDVAAVDPSAIPGFADVAPFLQNAPHYVVNGKHYGMPHGWGGNLLMFRSDVVKPAPTSWSVVFDPTQAAAYKGKVTAYDSPIYIADAALYLKAHDPSLGITDPYELSQPQFDAAVNLLKQQRPNVGKYWSLYTDEIDNFKSGATVVGTTWPYQLNVLKGENVPVDGIVPSEGMTGWADTWMMSAHAQHPNCMLKWMAWMITPEVQAMVAEYFGEAPANPNACKYLDATYGSYGVKDFCTLYRVTDQSFYGQISFWKTPLPDCGDSRGQTCVDYSIWTQKWTEIKG
jgi:putative spermidine/putrescine transport system substrate-binding protein